MLYDVFTPEFRKHLNLQVRSATGNEARLLAAKASPVLSLFVAIFLLQYFPNYSYPALGALICIPMGVGAALAYALPTPFLLILRLLTCDPKYVQVRMPFRGKVKLGGDEK